MATAAEIIARRLAAAGCGHAFGIPGGEVLSLIKALRAAGLAVTLAKHENAAGFMAEGTYHATGAPGVMFATLGPGLANGVNVVANAYQDRVPLIVLTGCVDPAEAHSFTHQVMDHGALLQSVTKAQFRVVDGAVDVIADKAVRIATSGRPGPVLIDLPIALADREQPDRPAPISAPASPMAPAAGGDFDRAREMLGTAERPLMIAGLDVLTQGAEVAVASFAETFSVPVITTYKAKGVLPEDHALSLGAAGLSPKADEKLLSLVDQADLVLAVGYDPIEMRAGWRNPWDPAKAIEFAAVANDHYVHQADLAFVGHVGAGLDALGQGMAPRATWSNGAPTATRDELQAAFASGEDWGPGAVIAAARKALPADGIATVDTGAHRILLSQAWTCTGARTLLQSTGLCTMGVALPMAVGVKLAAPDRPILALTGDAGLEMVLGELATVRDLKLPLVVVVFVDEQLALIDLKQRGRGHDNLAVDFGATDFPAVARALGGNGVLATDRDTLAGEITAGFARDSFTVIACPIGRGAYDGAF